MSSSQSSGIELSTILLYALDEKGPIQHESETPRGTGEEHVFFLHRGRPWPVFSI